MAKPCLQHAHKFLPRRAALGATLVTALAGSGLIMAAPAQAATTGTPANPIAEAQHHAERAKADAYKINVSAAQVLALAKAQVGTSENSRGGGTKFQRWYAQSQRALETIRRDGGSRAGYLNAAWCAMFVSWVGEHAGARPQVGWDAYTVTHAKWFKDNDRWGSAPKPGAVVFFSWRGGKSVSAVQHVGFVVKDNKNGTISTIEGNTGNGSVEQRVRPKWQVVGYGYPEYAA